MSFSDSLRKILKKTFSGRKTTELPNAYYARLLALLARKEHLQDEAPRNQQALDEAHIAAALDPSEETQSAIQAASLRKTMSEGELRGIDGAIDNLALELVLELEPLIPAEMEKAIEQQKAAEVRWSAAIHAECVYASRFAALRALTKPQSPKIDPQMELGCPQVLDPKTDIPSIESLLSPLPDRSAMRTRTNDLREKPVSTLLGRFFEDSPLPADVSERMQKFAKLLDRRVAIKNDMARLIKDCQPASEIVVGFYYDDGFADRAFDPKECKTAQIARQSIQEMRNQFNARFLNGKLLDMQERVAAARAFSKIKVLNQDQSHIGWKYRVVDGESPFLPGDKREKMEDNEGYQRRRQDSYAKLQQELQHLQARIDSRDVDGVSIVSPKLIQAPHISFNSEFPPLTGSLADTGAIAS